MTVTMTEDDVDDRNRSRGGTVDTVERKLINNTVDEPGTEKRLKSVENKTKMAEHSRKTRRQTQETQ